MASEIRVNKIENRSGLGTVTFADTGVDLAGILTATTFSGSGASLTNLPAANVTGTLPAISGANLTNLAAANLTGTIADARFPATLPAVSAANLTSIPAANVTGTLPALTAVNLTNIPAANLVGVCTSGLTKTGGFGKIVQIVSTTKTDTASNSQSSQAWWSYTDSSLIATITPTSSSNKIMITGTVNLGVDSQQWLMVRLEKDGSRLNAGNGDQDGNKSRTFTAQNYPPETTPSVPYPNHVIQYLDTAGNTNSRYYNFGFAHTSSLSRTIYLNRGVRTSNDFYTPQCASTITVMEIEA